MLGPIGHIEIRASNPGNPITVFEYIKSSHQTPNNNSSKSKSPSKSYSLEKPNHEKPPGINFLKRNQQELKSHSLLTQNYSPLSNEELDKFTPVGMRPPLPAFYRRTAVKATCIGYYDHRPTDSHLTRRDKQYS